MEEPDYYLARCAPNPAKRDAITLALRPPHARLCPIVYAQGARIVHR